MRKFDNINVIPFIDIMLVLLAIVLTTATFVNNGQLDITLPKSGAESQEVRSDLVRLSIDSDANYFVDDEQMSVDEMSASLGLLDKQTPINLMIDETVEFQQFIVVIELLKSLSLEQVAILTRKPQ